MKYFQVNSEQNHQFYCTDDTQDFVWLGNGFYFWEHSFFAYLWKKKKERDNPKTIFNVYYFQNNFEQNEILDLCSNTEHMLIFYQVVKKIHTRFPNIQSLCGLIKKLNNFQFFDKAGYIGIRCNTPHNSNKIKFCMKENIHTNFFYFQKIILCIFPQNHHLLKDRAILHNFADNEIELWNSISLSKAKKGI